MDPINGLHGIMKRISGNTDGFIRMLKKIICRLKGKTFDLWVDKAKWRKGKKVTAFLAEHSFFYLHYLPAYRRKLNCQERLWHTFRYEETTDVYFETSTDLDRDVIERSQRRKPRKIKQLCQLI